MRKFFKKKLGEDFHENFITAWGVLTSYSETRAENAVIFLLAGIAMFLTGVICMLLGISINFTPFGLIVIVLTIFGLNYVVSNYYLTDDVIRKYSEKCSSYSNRKILLLTVVSIIMFLVIFIGGGAFMLWSNLSATYFRQLWGWNI